MVLNVKDAAGATQALDEATPGTAKRQIVIQGDQASTATNPVDPTYGDRTQLTGLPQAVVAGTLAAVAATVAATTGIANMGNATIRVTGGTGGVTFVFEVSEDGGTTWIADQVRRERDSQPVNGDTLIASQSELYTFDLPAVNAVRVRATAVGTAAATVRIGAGGLLAMPIVAIGNRQAATAPTTAGRTAVTTAAQLLAANNGRRKWVLYNEGPAATKILLGAGTPSATNYTFELKSGQAYEDDVWTGRVAAFTVTGTATVMATELTP